MPRVTYEGLKKQIAKLQAQAAKMEASHLVAKKRAVAKVTALMKRLGVSVADLKGTEPKKESAKSGRKGTERKVSAAGKRAVVAVKYRHPETGETWTGRGKPPRWLAAEIASGKAKEQFSLLDQSEITSDSETQTNG